MPFKKKVDISVCIATYNSEKTLRACLDSISRQTVDPKEVLICDGGSKDRTLEILKEYPVKIIAKNVKSFGSARNVLASAASAKIIAWIDSDTVISVNWLELRGKIHREHPEIDCLSGPLPVVTLEEANKRSKIPIPEEIDPQPCEIFVEDGATIKRELVQRVGGYDGFFEWGADWDLRTRMLRTGARLYCSKTCLSYHIRPKTSVKWTSRFFIYEPKGTRVYFRDYILAGNFVCFLLKYGFWYIRFNPRHFATFLLRLWLLYSLIGTFILPVPTFISFILAATVNLVACKIHHKKLKVGFLSDQLLKAVGEHRNFFRYIVYRIRRPKAKPTILRARTNPTS